MVNNVKDSLIVSALLDASVKLENAAIFQGQTIGNVNKQTLTNRVKKLDDDVRLELMSELNHILLLLQGNSQSAPPLQERGLCVILLTDDGAQASSRGFFGTIYQIFLNYCGYSVCSETIVNKISDVQIALLRAGLQRANVPMTASQMRDALDQHVGVMQNGINDHFEANAEVTEATIHLAVKNRKCEEVKSLLEDLQGLMPSEKYEAAETARFANAINKVSEFTVNNITSLKDCTTHLHNALHYITLVVGSRFSDLVQELKKESLFFADLVNKTHFSLKEAAFLRKVVLSIARKKIINFMAKVDEEVVLETQKNLVSFKRLQLLKDRLILLANNEPSLIASFNAFKACQEIEALRIQNADTFEKAKVLERVCNSIDPMLAESVDPKYDKFKEFVRTYIQVINYGTDADLKKEHSYLEKLAYVNDVLNSEKPSMLIEMVQSINLSKYLPLHESNPAQKEVYTKLKPFVDQGNTFPLQTDEARKTLALAYLNYLKFLFSAEKTVLLKEIGNRINRIDLLRNTPPLELASLNPGNIPPIQNPASPAMPTIQPMEQFPEHPQGQLKAYAQALFHIHSNSAMQAENIFQRLEKSPFNSYAETVYHNFYFIMLKADRIDKGREDRSWGGRVFQGEAPGSYVKNTFPEELNQFRARAMYLASLGKKVGENHPDLNLLPPPL